MATQTQSKTANRERKVVHIERVEALASKCGRGAMTLRMSPEGKRKKRRKEKKVERRGRLVRFGDDVAKQESNGRHLKVPERRAGACERDSRRRISPLATPPCTKRVNKKQNKKKEIGRPEDGSAIT